MEEIKVFCPATIANVSCGFDVLGLALESVGDWMTVRKSTEKGIRRPASGNGKKCGRGGRFGPVEKEWL